MSLGARLTPFIISSQSPRLRVALGDARNGDVLHCASSAFALATEPSHEALGLG
jgi:hypothetical protein